METIRKHLMRIFILILLLLKLNAVQSQTKRNLNDSLFERGDIIIIPEVFFNFCFRLPSGICMESLDSIAPVAEFLKNNPTINVEIESHTDTRGNKDSNLKLTQERADIYRTTLINHFNIEKERVKTKGMGAEFPIVSDKEIAKAQSTMEKEKLHQMNRRIFLRVRE